MKYLDEFRNPETVKKYAEAIHKTASRPWRIMEICGGQTHSIMRFGLEGLLPDSLDLVHGPGCPVCVTPIELIDCAIEIARKPEVVFCSFGDMLRVPGSETDMFSAKADGGDVRIVYSPLDAVRLARKHPDKQVVFFAVGFETTAPANAMAVLQADKSGIDNFSMVVSHVLVPPAIEAISASRDSCIQGFLTAGHVCAVMGYNEYEPIAERYKIPMVVTGFEPVDILHGIYRCVSQLEKGIAKVENAYSRTVRPDGNKHAKKTVNDVFKVVTRNWRGIGEIPDSGLDLRDEFIRFDAVRKFGLSIRPVSENTECKAGEVLQGILKPDQCPVFGSKCTPEHPLGAPMVSSEGACAAYYRYHGKG
ncbi:MAG: hydrogenase formation protein HypD [Verrucomicrobia bacterium]|nr:hydrogenase formation protein HypD [Verrucomicrobiota bacterium]